MCRGKFDPKVVKQLNFISTKIYFLSQEHIYTADSSQVQRMENVHLAPETDEDDLYSGYNDYNPTYDTEVRNQLFLMLVFAEQLVHQKLGFKGSALLYFK